MTGQAVKTFDNNEALRPVSTAMNIREPCHPRQAQWMAHWMLSSSRSISQSHKHIATSDERNRIHLLKQGCLLDNSIKSGEAKILSRNLSSNTEYKEVRRSDSREKDLPSYLYTRAEATKSENRSFQIRNSHIEEQNDNLIQSKVFSDALFAHKLPGSSGDCRNFDTFHCLGSDNLDSDWEHLPVFDLNHKVGCSAAGKRKYDYDIMVVRKNGSKSSLSLHGTKLASEEHQFQTWSLTQDANRCTGPMKFINVLPSHQLDYMGPYSRTSFHEFHHPTTNMRTSICGRKKGHYFSSGIGQKEYFANTNHFCSELDRSDPYKNSTLLVSKIKDVDGMLDQSFGSTSSGPKDGAMQLLIDCCYDRTMQIDTSSRLSAGHNNKQGVSKLEDYRYMNNVPKCSCHDAETGRICTPVNSRDGMRGRSDNLSIASRCLLVKAKMGVELPKVDQMIRGWTVSNEVKGADQQPSLVYAIAGESKDFVLGLEANMETQTESSAKTDTIYVDVGQTAESPSGETSFPSRKDFLVLYDLKKSQSAEASPVSQGVTKMETQHPDDDTNSLLSNRAGFPNARGAMSRTESISTDHILLNVDKPNQLNSSPIGESSLGPERSSSWVKRLKHNASCSQNFCMKRFKIGDASNSGDSRPFFRTVLNCNESSSLPKHMKEHELDGSMFTRKNTDCTFSESRKKECVWIHRWRHSSQQKGPLQARLAVPLLCEPEKSKVAEKKFEGKHFPSIKAMALMGKAFNSFRPCRYRRRGSAVVWNTEGF